MGALRPGGDRDRALALAQTAKEQAPEDPQVSDTLGWNFYRRGPAWNHSPRGSLR